MSDGAFILGRDDTVSHLAHWSRMDEQLGQGKATAAAADAWLHSLRDLRLLELRPAAMRDYAPKSPQLLEDGGNLSGVLAQLADDPTAKQEVVDWMEALCHPEITGIDFDETKLGYAMALFRQGDVTVSAASASDGTLRFLALLLAVKTAKKGSTIVIEDIERGIHPTRIHLLTEFLQSATDDGEVQVIATTHSPWLLEWLSDDALANTVVFGRVPQIPGTIMRRLGTLPHFDAIFRKKAAELFSTGWLEMAL